jgi:hypothetical protein
MNFYDLTVPVFTRSLHQIGQWLDKAAAHATAKKFDVDTLVHARLAPDQYALARQVQAACDAAKFTCARLTGKDAPSHPDTETTIEQLRARIRTVMAYLETFTPADFEGAADRKITMPWAPGMHMRGTAYLVELQLPNFFFHCTTAYGILRHNGVDLGKRDFLGNIALEQG